MMQIFKEKRRNTLQINNNIYMQMHLSLATLFSPSRYRSLSVVTQQQTVLKPRRNYRHIQRNTKHYCLSWFCFRNSNKNVTDIQTHLKLNSCFHMEYPWQETIWTTLPEQEK